MVNTYSHISFKKLIIKHQNINVGFILFFSFWPFILHICLLYVYSVDFLPKGLVSWLTDFIFIL